MDLPNNDPDEELTCPLCMEVLDETDRNFYPCTCDYQVCLWCLHYIRTTMGNKCPACRRDYDESNMKYKCTTYTQAPPRNSTTKKKRDLGDKEATTREERSHSPRGSSVSMNLKDVRVIQRNLVYVVGIPYRVAKKEILKQTEYFGQYGKIQHIVINKSQNYNSHIGGPSYTAYVTYSKKSEAATAIQAIDGSQIDGRQLRASYGTTKYCSYFFKGLKCTNSECYYLHHIGDERERISKDDLASLMHKSPNPPFGVVDNGRDYSATSKFKEEHPRKRQDNHPRSKPAATTHARIREPLEQETFSGYSMAKNDGDMSSWSNVASGAREANMQNDNMTYYVYQHPEELQLQYAVLGEGYSDGYAHAFDGYQQRPDGDCNPNDGVVNNYLTNIDMDDSNIAVSLDQYDMMQRLLSRPLLLELQRYNRCNHLVYCINSPIRYAQVYGNYDMQHLDGNISDDDDARGSKCSRWMPAEEVKNVGALRMANRRRQIDYYKGMNQLAPSMTGEDAISPVAPSLGPKQFFTSRKRTEEILYKIKRHSTMLQNLAKQYKCDPQHRRQAADKYDREHMEVYKSASSSSYSSADESTIMDFTPFSSMVADTESGRYVSSILYAPSMSESQLDTEIEIQEKLRNEALKLHEVELAREERFARHLALLDDF